MAQAKATKKVTKREPAATEKADEVAEGSVSVAVNHAPTDVTVRDMANQIAEMQALLTQLQNENGVNQSTTERPKQPWEQGDEVKVEGKKAVERMAIQSPSSIYKPKGETKIRTFTYDDAPKR